MRPFKSDLARSFAIGFALGAVIVFSTVGSWTGSIGSDVVPAAIAAPVR